MFLDVNPTYFAERTAASKENNCSTTDKLDKGVLYLINTSGRENSGFPKTFGGGFFFYSLNIFVTATPKWKQTISKLILQL